MNQIDTSNWSGYAVAQYETGTSYTSATATWVVPSVSAPAGFTNAYSSSWVGIGGFCENGGCHKVDSTLIQLGTEQDATSSGASSYSAWYELLPAAPVTIPSLSVSSGDTVTASLSDPATAATATTASTRTQVDNKNAHSGGGSSGGGGGHGGGHGGGGGSATQSWTLTMTVTSPGGSTKTWSATVPYTSSELSAEWIEEAPAACVGGSCSILPLANYGAATFDPNSANGASPNLQPSQGIAMLNPNGQTSSPSVPSAAGDGFGTCWGSGTTLTSCPAP